MIEVIKPGLFTTIQDQGRKNYRRFGIPESGAMDEYNAFIANWLVNNPVEAPFLEITLSGPELKFHSKCLIALAGADFSAQLNGITVNPYQTIECNPGDVLTIGQPQIGCRTYLAVNGGIASTKFLNSNSTYTLAGIGGFKGRQLKKGDQLKLLKPIKIRDKKYVPEHLQTRLRILPTIRVIEGPEFYLLDEESPMGLAGRYQILINSDRMGIILSGFKGEVVEKEIISSPVAKGTIQVLPDNKLCVLMSDGQVSGGYPRIGNVISADLHLMAQLRPGDEVKFKIISIEEAHHLWWHQVKLLESLNHTTLEKHK